MKLTKKEKQLYMNHGKQWDIYIHHVITISESDSVNILKTHDKIITNYDLTILKRETKRIKLLFGYYLYFNTVYGGINNERVE